MSGRYKIMVHSIPSDVSRSNFGDLFLNYEDVLTMYIDESNVFEGKRSGYVIFRSKRECYRAISELNGQPPYFLHLQFSTSSNESKEIYFETKGNALDCPSSHNNPWTEKCHNGGGQINKKSPIGSSVPSLIKPELSFKCRACYKVSLKSCANCGVLYCSKLCQTKDWDRHKNECSKLECYPSRFQIANSKEYTNSKINQIKGAVNDKKTVTNQEKKLRILEKKCCDQNLGLGQESDKIEKKHFEMYQEDSNRVKNCFDLKMKEKNENKCPANKERRPKSSRVCNPNSVNNDCHSEGEWEDITVNEDCKKGRAQVKQDGKNIQGSNTKGIFQGSANDRKIADDRKDTCDISVNCRPNVNGSKSRGMGPEEKNNPAILPEHSSISSPKISMTEAANNYTCTKQNKPEQNETTKQKLISSTDQWDLFSYNPDKQIINYDLCTQQKKLSSEKFSKVTINVTIAPDEYWVHCDSDLEEYKMIMRLMIRKSQPSDIPYIPVVGNYCSVLFEKIAYRAKVLSVEETRAEVLLIDLGNNLYFDFKDMSELPHLAKNYYAHAVHVKLDPWTPEEYLNLPEDSNLSLKAVGLVNEGFTKVHVEGVVYAQILPVPKLPPSPTAVDKENKEDTSQSNEVKTQWPPSVLGILKEGQTAACTVLSVHMNDDNQKDELILAIAVDDIATDLESILIDFPQDCLDLPEDSNFSPSVGDLLAAYNETKGIWVRAVVLGVGDSRWLVACCDFGVIVEVTKVRKIPTGRNYIDIPSLTAKCYVVSSKLPRDDLFSDERIKENSALNILVGKRKGDSINCAIGVTEGQPFCTVSLEVWAPTVDKPGGSKITNNPELEYMPLISGAPVKIVSFFLSMVMYVQPCDAQSKKDLEELQNVISDYTEKCVPLKEIPEVSQMCICMFSGDMKHYRVVINKVKCEEKILVTFIDFGNDEEVSLSRLYDIPSTLKKIPCFGVKIGLKKDFEKPLTKEANNFLSSLIIGNTELTLMFPEGNLRNCELIMQKGTLVNDILKKLIDPPTAGNEILKVC